MVMANLSFPNFLCILRILEDMLELLRYPAIISKMGTTPFFVYLQYFSNLKQIIYVLNTRYVNMKVSSSQHNNQLHIVLLLSY
jgi:hypothetical protein